MVWLQKHVVALGLSRYLVASGHNDRHTQFSALSMQLNAAGICRCQRRSTYMRLIFLFLFYYFSSTDLL